MLDENSGSCLSSNESRIEPLTDEFFVVALLKRDFPKFLAMRQDWILKKIPAGN